MGSHILLTLYSPPSCDICYINLNELRRNYYSIIWGITSLLLNNIYVRIFNLQTRCVVDQFFKANVNFCIALNLERGRIVNQLFKANQPNLVLIIIAKCQKVKTLSFLNYLFNGIFLPTRNRISNGRNLQLIYKSEGMVLSSKKLGIRNNRVGITGVRLCLWQLVFFGLLN